MATTNFAVNDAFAIKLWAKMLDVEALKFTDIAPLIGTDAGSIIHQKTEISKGKGDQVTFGLRMQLSGDGFTENELAEGNGEALTINSETFRSIEVFSVTASIYIALTLIASVALGLIGKFAFRARMRLT